MIPKAEGLVKHWHNNSGLRLQLHSSLRRVTSSISSFLFPALCGVRDTHGVFDDEECGNYN